LSLSCEGMELASEIVVKAARAGLDVAEVPIVYHPRTGESKLQSLPDAWRHMRFLLLLSPLHVFIWPGLLLFGAGFSAQALLLGLGSSQLGLRLSALACASCCWVCNYWSWACSPRRMPATSAWKPNPRRAASWSGCSRWSALAG